MVLQSTWWKSFSHLLKDIIKVETVLKNKLPGCPLQKVNKKKEVKDRSLFLMTLLSSRVPVSLPLLSAFFQFIITH